MMSLDACAKVGGPGESAATYFKFLGDETLQTSQTAGSGQQTCKHTRFICRRCGPSNTKVQRYIYIYREREREREKQI